MADDREPCERCGEIYHRDENLEICARCKRLVCPRCSTQVMNPVKNKPEWKCDACLFPHELHFIRR